MRLIHMFLVLGLCATLLMSSVSRSEAQERQHGTVEGRASRAGTGEALTGARIELTGTDLATVTAPDGRYRFDNVPPGRYELVVITADGKRFPAANVTVEPGMVLDLPLPIQVNVNTGVGAGSPLAGSEVIIVTGTRVPEKISEAPLPVDSMSGEEIRRLGRASFGDALATARGIDHSEVSMLDQYVTARTFNKLSPEMLWFVDGRLANDTFGFAHAEMLPVVTEDIKSIEAVSGPASALYGPNAHTGLINVRTKTPWDDSGASLTLRGGSQSLLDGSFRVAGVVSGTIGWKLIGGYKRAEELSPDRDADTHYYGTTLFEGDLIPDYDVSATKLAPSLYYKRGDWHVEGGYGWSEFEIFGVNSQGRTNMEQSENRFYLSLNHPNWYAHASTTATDWTGYDLRPLAQAAQQRLDEGMSLTASDLETLREQLRGFAVGRAIDAEFHYRKTLASLTMVAGAQGRQYQTEENAIFDDPEDGDIQYTDIGGFAQLDYKLWQDRLRAIGALRVDAPEHYGVQLSPQATLVYNLSPANHVRVSYNRAYKSPNILNLYFSLQDIFLGNLAGYTIRDPAGGVVREIPALEPERVNSVELGYKSRLLGSLFVDFTVYSSWYDNFISQFVMVADGAMTLAYRPNGEAVAAGTPVEGMLFTHVNYGSALIQGANIGLDYYASPHVLLSTTASWISLADFQDEGLGKLELNVPELKVHGAVTIDGWGFDNYFVNVGARYRSPYNFAAGVWQDDMPSRFVASISAGYRFPAYGLAVQATVENLFNNTTPDIPGAPPPHILAFLGMTYTYQGLNVTP